MAAAAQVSAVPQIYDIWVQKQQKNKKATSYAKGVNRGEVGKGGGVKGVVSNKSQESRKLASS